MPISDWDAQRYDQFTRERQRPARDLLLGIPASLEVRQATDLGCGSGLSTELLRQRWPAARLTGIDNSPAMLERARQRLGDVDWRCESIADFDPREPQDLIFANASLHWLADHRSLLTRLVSALRPGGVLALQMPDNLEEASHRAMRDVARRLQYKLDEAATKSERGALLEIGEYYDCLREHCAQVDIWLTRYQHALPGVAGIFDWFATTGLKPWLDALEGDELRGAFRRDYLAAITPAYPPRADGSVLLALPRLFVVATRAA